MDRVVVNATSSSYFSIVLSRSRSTWRRQSQHSSFGFISSFGFQRSSSGPNLPATGAIMPLFVVTPNTLHIQMVSLRLHPCGIITRHEQEHEHEEIRRLSV